MKQNQGIISSDACRPKGASNRTSPPVWLEEGSMSKTDEYRQFADDCIVWARIATSDDQREQFLELAKKWLSDAERALIRA